VNGQPAYIYDLQFSNVAVSDTEVANSGSAVVEEPVDTDEIQDIPLDQRFALPFHFVQGLDGVVLSAEVHPEETEEIASIKKAVAEVSWLH
jgi:hypothetical protein